MTPRTCRVVGSCAAAVAAIVLYGVCSAPQSAQQRFDYPQTRKTDHVDTYHGTSVPDPYRWLEDDNSPETAQWVEAENKVTFAYLEKIPYRAELKKRLETLYNYPKYGAPSRKGEYFFFTKNDGLQNQSVLYVQKGLAGAPEVLIDPNTWSADGTVRLTAFALSKDGKYAAYGVSRSGSDWQEFNVMEIATKKTLPDKLEWVKVSGASWRGDGFFYSRYPAPAKGRELSSANENHQVYYHKVGTAQSADALVFHGGRTVRHPGGVGPREGQEGERGVRPRPVEERNGVLAALRHDRR
jgi:prolyl oligopeptidase